MSSDYQAPLADMSFQLFDVFQVDRFWAEQPTLAEVVDQDTAKAILGEAAKITEECIAPKSKCADEQGVSVSAGVVTTPSHYKENYRLLCEGGWTGLTGDPEYGGLGMPKTLASMYDEMMCSADIAFSLYPGLTSGACVALLQHADEAAKAIYLPKLYSGEWSGTMCLTESHAGSDLGIMRSKAEPQANGSYRISGEKIFITAGEHELAENIIHLVLAKLPDAPAGSRGISLFLVPKFKVMSDGSLGERNQLICSSVEHKMGIHGSATCVMNFEGAEGYLIGQPHKGLACMFTMMNYERLAMGSQGLGAAERAYQNALGYAKERLQGRTQGTDANKADPILGHPDIKRMLLTVASLNEAGRAFSLMVAHFLDQAKFAADSTAYARANLLTPVTKAFMTDRGFDCCVMAQQVFGGHGYIKEWGMEQLVRDVRIAQIYEGTNGIQALDFMLRKVAADQGAVLFDLLDELTAQVSSSYAAELKSLVEDVKAATTELLSQHSSQPDLLSWVACDYLDLIGYTFYGLMWDKMLAALSTDKHNADFVAAKQTKSAFFFHRILPKTRALLLQLKPLPEQLLHASF
ncbi:acyl-CoA dehydrogenase family protein [Rheinheimera sp.]|uniref:acyl-CoA dehydrogenase family protein n=1 Tax=Rheinheimera sp. TaxID=1869214 RepID=UPI00307D8B70